MKYIIIIIILYQIIDISLIASLEKDNLIQVRSYKYDMHIYLSMYNTMFKSLIMNYRWIYFCFIAHLSQGAVGEGQKQSRIHPNNARKSFYILIICVSRLLLQSENLLHSI